MKTFKSVADLKLAKLRTGQFVETNGYYAEAGGGGAKYYVVASQAADEYGDHTLANGNVAVLQVDGVINVRQFGVTSEDSTNAIQAAVNAVGTSGTVLIQGIHTKISGRIDIFNKANFTVSCRSGSMTQLTDTTRMFNFYQSTDVEISGESFVLNGVGTDFNPSLRTTGAEGIRFTNCSNFCCKGLHFKNFGSAGIRTFESTVGIIENNTIQGTALDHSNISGGDNNQFGIDLYLAGSDRIKILNNTIFSTSQGVKTSYNNTIEISGNTIYSIVGQHGIYAGIEDYLTITNNVITDIFYDSIKVQIDDTNRVDDAEGLIISGNIIADSGNVGIEVLTLTGHTGVGAFSEVNIEDNIVTRTGNSSIFVRNIKNLLCSGNNMSNSGAQGLFGDGINGAISNNKIKLTDRQAVTVSPKDGGLVEIVSNLILDCCVAGSGSTDTAIEVAPPSAVVSCKASIIGNKLTFDTSSCTKSVVAGSSKIVNLIVQDNNLGDFLMDINVAGLTKFDNNLARGMQLGSPDTANAIWGDGGKRLFANTDPSTAGDIRQYYMGDVVHNIRPSIGEPIGWVCTGNGSPGTWRGFGTIL